MNSYQNKHLLNEFVLSPTTMTYPLYNENTTINNNNNSQFLPIHLSDKDINSDYIIPNTLTITPLNNILISDLNFNNNISNSINSCYSLDNSYPLNMKINNPLSLDSNSSVISNPIMWNINTQNNNDNNNNMKILNNIDYLSHNPDESCILSNLALNQNLIVNDNMSNYMKNNSNNSNYYYYLLTIIYYFLIIILLLYNKKREK